MTPQDSLTLWQACMDQLAQEMPEQQFNTWIKPLSATVASDFSKVTVYVANRFKMDWIRAQYASRIADLLAETYGQPVVLELALAQREVPAKPAFKPAVVEALAPAAPPALAEEPPTLPNKTRLNPALTFDTLVEGSANRMARAAAMHVANNPGQLYNLSLIHI